MDVNITERERQLLAQADSLNAILSQTNIPQAAEAAELRSRHQAAEQLQRQKAYADQTELEAALGMRQKLQRDKQAFDAEQRALDRGAYGRPTAKQREQATNLQGALVSLDSFMADLEALPEAQAAELGSTRSKVAAVTPEWARDWVEAGFSPEVQGLRAKGAFLDNYIREAVTSGVLSNMDVANLKPLALSGTPTADQIRNRAKEIRFLLNKQADTLGGEHSAPGTEDPYEYRTLPDGTRQRRLKNRGNQ